jgi:hypothetical protein
VRHAWRSTCRPRVPSLQVKSFKRRRHTVAPPVLYCIAIDGKRTAPDEADEVQARVWRDFCSGALRVMLYNKTRRRTKNKRAWPGIEPGTSSR